MSKVPVRVFIRVRGAQTHAAGSSMLGVIYTYIWVLQCHPLYCLVTVQVRPLLEHEVVLSCEECVRTVGEDQLVLGGNQTFRFDRVFPSSASQVNYV